jgi:hypothetical protein
MTNRLDQCIMSSLFARSRLRILGMQMLKYIAQLETQQYSVSVCGYVHLRVLYRERASDMGERRVGAGWTFYELYGIMHMLEMHTVP